MITDFFKSDLRNKVLPLFAAIGSSLCLAGSAALADDPSPLPLRHVEKPSAARKPDDGLMSAGKVKANGITIAFERFGPADREAVLMIMGMGAQLTAWPTELREELVKRGYQVIIFDNRDVGLSTKFDEAGAPNLKAIIKARKAGKPAPMPYTLDDMAKDAVGLLDALGIKKAHIVGVSMGGMIAQLVAADHPEHTLSLVSIMATSGNPAIPFPAKPAVLALLPRSGLNVKGDRETIFANALRLTRLLAGPKYPPDEKRIREIVDRTLNRADDRASIPRHNAAATLGLFEDRRAKLKTIKVPTVVVHGTEDPILSVEGGKDTAENIPGAEFRLIQGMGHDLPIALVDTFTDAITSAASRATGAKPMK